MAAVPSGCGAASFHSFQELASLADALVDLLQNEIGPGPQRKPRPLEFVYTPDNGRQEKKGLSMKKRFVSALLLGATLSLKLLTAQEAPTPSTPTPPTPAQAAQHRIGRLTTLLTLTSEQQTQATTIFAAEQNAASSLGTSMKEARAALRTAVEGNDTASISSVATQLGNLTTQQIEARAKADAAFYAILTGDQQAKYKELSARGPGGPHGPGHGPRGHGGPMPPAPPAI